MSLYMVVLIVTRGWWEGLRTITPNKRL